MTEAAEKYDTAPCLDWVIIGGGIHGVHLALRLLDQGEANGKSLRILDGGHRLLSRWRSCTEVTGMEHLRSPSVHHLGRAPMALHRFAGKKKNQSPDLFAYPYDRPSLSLFNRHCDRLIETSDLESLHLRHQATTAAVHENGIDIEHTGGRLTTSKLILAIGSSQHPHWPSWAPQDHPGIHHIFCPQFSGWPTDLEETIAVIGGGISSAQVALRLANSGHRVHLITRHPFREHQFDSDPGWLGPKSMNKFWRTTDVNERRRMIQEARHRGSIPPDILGSLHRAIKRGTITRHQAEPEKMIDEGTRPRLMMDDGSVVDADRVLLATGFASQRPGGAMINDLIESAKLNVADCGYPIVDSALRWHPRIHVTGPLAELELGPTSKNIAGARAAGDRILGSLRSAPSQSEERETRHSLPSLAPA